MRYFYDTEFNEDGHTIDLISIGIAAEDGREFYAVNADADWDRIHDDPWLMKNVVPHLGDTPRIPKAQIRDEVDAFILAGVRHVRDIPELWAYYGAYDHVVLAQLFGTMPDLPRHIPMWTNDIRQEQYRLGNPGMPAQMGRRHNALDDARHVRAQFEALREYSLKKGRR